MRSTAAKDAMAFNLDGLAKTAPSSKKARKKKAAPFPALSASAKALASALDHLGIVSIANLEGHIVYVNDAFLRISQYARKELIGKNHSILNSRSHPSEFWSSAHEKLAAGQIWRAPVKNRAKD